MTDLLKNFGKKFLNGLDLILPILLVIAAMLFFFSIGFGLADENRRKNETLIVGEDCVISGYVSRREKYIEKFREIGLFDEHVLKKFRVASGFGGEINGKLRGNFFWTVGSMEGGVDSYDSLKFAWELNKGEVTISVLPLEKIVIILDEEKKNPTIKFRFLIEDKIPEEKFDIAKESPYVLINSDYIINAKVRINSEDLEKEIYLPFNRPD
jgi:hypothetical protein